MERKTRIKSGLYLGAAITLFFILNDLITADDLSTKKLIIIIVSGLIWGAVSGFIFGWLLGINIQRKRKLITKSDHSNAHDRNTHITGENM